jgi:hypothetical protein
MARQTRVDHEALDRAARIFEENRSSVGRPHLFADGLPHPRIREKPAPFDQTRDHGGCSPADKFATGPQPSLPDDWNGGFLCACHGSTFDFAGRVFKNKPAPDNLEVPPHMYLSDTKLLIGEDKKA